MIYRLLADVVVVLHGLFVVFVVFGGLLVLRWPRVAWLHVPAALWGVLIEFSGWVCPLTPLEKALRHRAGEVGYAGDFIDHYVVAALYPAGLTRATQFVLGGAALALNVGVYSMLVARGRRAEGGRQNHQN